MDLLSRKIIEEYQRGFPLQSEPYAEMAKKLNVTEEQVICCLQQLQKQGITSRIGPVFNHKKAGASLLAAIKVPEYKIDEVAEYISGYAEVNHNYAREHPFNLWFVVTAPNWHHLDKTLDQMQDYIDLPILRLPMEKAYFIDLGFLPDWSNCENWLQRKCCG